MINTTLNYDQRINLELLLGQQRGDMRTISSLLRIIDAIHLTDEEQRACKLRAEAGRFCWDRSPDFPRMEVRLENGDACRLKEILAGYDQFVPSDSAWAQPVIDALADAK
jgi:hypothetical protein